MIYRRLRALACLALCVLVLIPVLPVAAESVVIKRLTAIPVNGGIELKVQTNDVEIKKIQWQRRFGRTWKDIPDASDAVYNFTDVKDDTVYTFRVVIKAGGRTKTSNFTQITYSASQDAIFPMKGSVANKNIAVHSSASLRSSKLGSLKVGDEVTVLRLIGAFAQVEWEGSAGYISANYLDLSFETEVTGVATKLTYAYADKSNKSTKVKRLGKKATVSLLAHEGRWWRVSIDGETAYVGIGAVKIK